MCNPVISYKVSWAQLTGLEFLNESQAVYGVQVISDVSVRDIYVAGVFGVQDTFHTPPQRGYDGLG